MLIEYLYKKNEGKDAIVERTTIKPDHELSFHEITTLKVKSRAKVVDYDVFGCGLYDTETKEFYTFGKMSDTIRAEIDKACKDSE